MSIISTNIKQLRIEARLSIEELAEKTNIDAERIRQFEKGKLEPSNAELQLLCPVLRIHLEDMLERDILAERNEAYKNMKKDKNYRTNYNWYLGDKKKLLLYSLILVLLPLLYFIIFYFNNQAKILVDQQIAEGLLDESTRISLLWVIISPLFFLGIPVGGVIIWLIFVIKQLRFQPIYIFWFLIGLSLIELLGIIGFIPLWIFSFIQVVFKRGKAR